ncbi:NmrA family NAD(P)-binding protein [Nocardia sp. alder85J]|uniref:NmrA family NAD(P)-binding protein n=1 Tax=Nocardia sp. alder85J TaxID=2862949 RepID=UPI0021046247|nr:NmrA family NAD(P)-binding protein [Nocardia sp. alder85J]MCX4098187.1 NAD(P)H-binding protein [Nocardia sp. alder85J]
MVVWQRVLVTGATGNTGSRVVAGLRQRGIEVRAASRSGAVRFDWDEPDTWAAAVTGVDAMYLATPMTNAGFGAAAVGDFVEYAVAQGVRRIVLLAGRSARACPSSPYMRALEEPVRASGVEWTVLSPGVFQQNFLTEGWRAGIRTGAVERVEAVPDVPVDFIDVADIAEVAVRVFTGAGHGGATYELSGPRALSFREAVGLIARTLDRPVTYRRIDLADWLADARARELPDIQVDFMTVNQLGQAGGAYSVLHTGVQEVLGRAPSPFERFVREAAATGEWVVRDGPGRACTTRSR